MADVFVVGSINQDFVLKVEKRPETGRDCNRRRNLSSTTVAKARTRPPPLPLLGASVGMLGRVGDDGLGEPAGRGAARERRRHGPYRSC